MEASEKPQLPIDAVAEPTVRAINGHLAIESLTVADERAARVVRERAGAGDEAAAIVRKMIEIGARVLESEGAAANVDYVRAELERNVGGLAEHLSQLLEAGGEELGEQIATTFGADRSDSVQQQIKELIGKANEEQRAAIARLFSSEEGTNPLVDFKQALSRTVSEAAASAQRQSESLREAHEREAKAQREQIATLREEIVKLRGEQEADERVAEAEEAGTRKGIGFEERVHYAIERIAAARGDTATHTGGEQAEGGGRKGDTVVELGGADGPATGRILFEAKDKKLSKNQAWTELNDGMAARAAGFGVLVVAGESRIPSGREPLTEYEGNKLIAPVDPEDPDGLALEIAYRLAAARVAMSRDRELQVDAAAVRDAAEEAVSTLKQAQAIRSNLTGIKTSSDKARANLDAMVEAVRAKLERIDSLVSD